MRWPLIAMLYLWGAIVLAVGFSLPWFSIDGPAPDADWLDMWRRGRIVWWIGSWGILLALVLAVGILVWFAVRYASGWKGPFSSEVRAAAFGSTFAGVASLGFVIATMYLAYEAADTWRPRDVAELGDTPLARASITRAPWLLVVGLDAIAVAGILLARAVKRAR